MPELADSAEPIARYTDWETEVQDPVLVTYGNPYAIYLIPLKMAYF